MPETKVHFAPTRWEIGTPISDAWLTFADERSALVYRAKRDFGAREYQRAMMITDMWEKLETGELVATGFQVTPTVSDGPINLPDFIFLDPPSPDLDNGDSINSLGRCFRHVRITAQGQINEETERSASTLDIPEKTEVAPQQRGRPSNRLEFAHAVRNCMVADALFLERPQKYQIIEVQAETKRLYPGRFPGSSLPGKSTVARFLKGQREYGWPALASLENLENLGKRF